VPRWVEGNNTRLEDIAEADNKSGPVEPDNEKERSVGTGLEYESDSGGLGWLDDQLRKEILIHEVGGVQQERAGKRVSGEKEGFEHLSTYQGEPGQLR
jgi:hypothetical protein